MKPETDDKSRFIAEIRETIRRELHAALCDMLPGGREPGVDEPARVLSGSLRYFRLPEVMHILSLQGMTGRLSLSHAAKHVDIYFRHGDVAYATGESRAGREQLGSLLVGMGRITSGALEDALAKCRKTGERLGRVLVGDGLVSEPDMHSALIKQTERSVYRAMAWGDGNFAFELCDMPEFIQDIPLGLKVEGLILEGVRRVEEIRLVSEKIPRLDIVFTKPAYTPEELEGMGLKPEEKRVLGLVDGETDVNGLISGSGLGEFGLLRALYALYSAGIIKKAGQAARSDRTEYL